MSLRIGRGFRVNLSRTSKESNALRIFKKIRSDIFWDTATIEPSAKECVLLEESRFGK